MEDGKCMKLVQDPVVSGVEPSSFSTMTLFFIKYAPYRQLLQIWGTYTGLEEKLAIIKQ